MTIELTREALHEIAAKIADEIWETIKERFQNEPEENCQAKPEEQNEVSQDTSISADVQKYHKFSSVLEIAKRIKIPNLTRHEFMIELSRRCGFIIPYTSDYQSRLSKSLSYKFKNISKMYVLSEERRRDCIALVSSGMKTCHALTLSKFTNQSKLNLSLDQCEIARRVFALYKDHKLLIDNYAKNHPEFKLPDFTQLENEVSNGISLSLAFNRRNALYSHEKEICDAVNEIINIPNLSQFEFQFKLSQKLGILVLPHSWRIIRTQIPYQFSPESTGSLTSQERIDRIADFASLRHCGVKRIDATVFAQLSSIYLQRYEKWIERFNIQPSDERVYRLYQESKELYDNYAKNHPEFKLPDFTKFDTDSNIFNSHDKEKEHVVIEESISKTANILTCDKVKKLCDAYEHVVKTTTLTGIKAIRKAREYAKVDNNIASLKKYIFGHIYIDKCYQDIPTPVYVPECGSPGIEDPEIRRQICTIKLFRKKGFSITRIEKLFKEHGEKVSSNFINHVYTEISFTQLGENLSNKEELSIAYQYKEQFPELKAHMRDDLKPSNQ